MYHTVCETKSDICIKFLMLTIFQVAYFGKTSKIVDFFNSVGLYCPANYNPADFIGEYRDYP